MRGPLLWLPVLGALLVGSPAEAAVRKCSMVPSFGVRVDPLIYLMVDEEILGPIPEEPLQPPESGGKVDSSLGTTTGYRVEKDDIFNLEIRCVEMPDGDQTVLRQMIDITTWDGAYRFLERELVELAAVQEAWKTTWGRYARTPAELQRRFPRLRPDRLVLNATDSGWSAALKSGAMPGGGSVECHVANGDAELPRPGMTRGVVSCFRN